MCDTTFNIICVWPNLLKVGGDGATPWHFKANILEETLGELLAELVATKLGILRQNVNFSEP